MFIVQGHISSCGMMCKQELYVQTTFVLSDDCKATVAHASGSGHLESFFIIETFECKRLVGIGSYSYPHPLP